MSKYHLTEAYGNLYNPRKADETFYENLRFVDYLMQEEIEEVMESLLWEFMDYGNTLDESYDLIESVFSDDVILEGVLMELNPYAPAGSREARQYAASTTRSKRGAERAAKITGALKAAKKTVGNIATGVRDAAVSGYRGAKQMAGSAYTAGRKGASDAKAGLQKLVRRGAMAAGSAGRSMEKAGQQARRQAQTAAGGASYSGSSALERSRARTAGLEAAGKTGSKRQAIGRLLRQAGAMVGRAVGRGSSGRGSSTSDEYPITTQRVSGGFDPSKKSSTKRKLITNPLSARKARKDSGSQRSRVAPGTTGKRGEKKVRGGATYDALGRRIRENYDFELLAQYIMEDFINEGYADTYEEALEILENLSEGSILELTEMYLEG